jgi:hypothetical protein
MIDPLINYNSASYQRYKWYDLLEFAKILNETYNKNQNDIINYLNNTKYFTTQITDVFFYEAPDTKADFMSFINNDILYLCFIGSDDIIDWFYDFQLWQIKIKLPLMPTCVEQKYCKIHNGIYKQYQSIQSNILDVYYQSIRLSLKPKIIIFSHSLGILGELAGIDLKNINPNIEIDNISFGAPRIGDKYFVDVCNKVFTTNLRIVNDDDIIPSFQFLQYKHSGKVIILEENNKICYKDRNIWNDLKNVILAFFYWIPFFKITVLQDHHLDNYIKIIAKMQDCAGSSVSN